MRIEAQGRRGRTRSAFTMVELMVAVLLMSICVVSLYAGFSSGFSVIQGARENLRATQIMLQKMETIRLYKWSQLTNSAYINSSFTEYYDPSGATSNSAGVMYQGQVIISPASVSPAYAGNMRAVTVRLFWTNNATSPSSRKVQSREMQTLVARYGMQNYLP